MSASDHLQPAQFFRGTIADLQPGDLIETGHPVTSRSGQLDNVQGEHTEARGLYNHAASVPGIAVNYALRAAVAARGGYSDLPQQRVYAVTPTGEHDTDPAFRQAESSHRRNTVCDSAKCIGFSGPRCGPG